MWLLFYSTLLSLSWQRSQRSRVCVLHRPRGARNSGFPQRWCEHFSCSSAVFSQERTVPRWLAINQEVKTSNRQMLVNLFCQIILLFSVTCPERCLSYENTKSSNRKTLSLSHDHDSMGFQISWTRLYSTHIDSVGFNKWKWINFSTAPSQAGPDNALVDVVVLQFRRQEDGFCFLWDAQVHSFTWFLWFSWNMLCSFSAAGGERPSGRHQLHAQEQEIQKGTWQKFSLVLLSFYGFYHWPMKRRTRTLGEGKAGCKWALNKIINLVFLLSPPNDTDGVLYRGLWVRVDDGKPAWWHRRWVELYRGKKRGPGKRQKISEQQRSIQSLERWTARTSPWPQRRLKKNKKQNKTGNASFCTSGLRLWSRYGVR